MIPSQEDLSFEFLEANSTYQSDDRWSWWEFHHPQFPGCIAAADTLHELREHAMQAIKDWHRTKPEKTYEDAKGLAEI